MRHLHPRLPDVRQSAAGQQYCRPLAKKCAPGLTSTRTLPLHRLQTPGRFGHGRRGGPARRKKKEDCCGNPLRTAPSWVHLSSSLGRRQGHRRMGFRRRCYAPHAARHIAPGPGAGGSSHANIRASILRGGKDDRRGQVVTWKDVKGRNAITGLITFQQQGRWLDVRFFARTRYSSSAMRSDRLRRHRGSCARRGCRGQGHLKCCRPT